jgi:hypothetical protein
LHRLAVGNNAADAPGMLPELFDTESFETADAADCDYDTLEADSELFCSLPFERILSSFLNHRAEQGNLLVGHWIF